MQVACIDQKSTNKRHGTGWEGQVTWRLEIGQGGVGGVEGDGGWQKPDGDLREGNKMKGGNGGPIGSRKVVQMGICQWLCCARVGRPNGGHRPGKKKRSGKVGVQASKGRRRE